MTDIPSQIFITGIGTDVGKSYATGWLARELAARGIDVITQKFIQTGNHDMSEDIEVHREIMGISLQDVDTNHITAPVIFTYPASPDLAARIDNKTLDMHVIEEATSTLSARYDVVLIEGAGGIMVPLHKDYLTIDYITDHNLPAIVVTNGRLGSVSDTLLTLEAVRHRGIHLYAVIYNPYFDKDATIAADSRTYMQEYIRRNFNNTIWLEMPETI